VFVPARWWHTVLNLEDTIAVTQNFCSRWNLRDVWRCTAATHPVLARRFRACLQREHPGAHREMVAAEQQRPPGSADDPGVSYLGSESDLPARGDGGAPGDQSSSDEEYLAWAASCGRAKRPRQEGTAPAEAAERTGHRAVEPVSGGCPRA